MSKFLDRLDKITRGVPAPMGFGTSGRAEKLPTMALIGLLSRSHNKGASLLAKINADGALIQGAETEAQLQQLGELLGDIPWGVSVQNLSEDGASRYLEQGCNFLAFTADQATLAALSGEDTAYLLYISPDLEERSLRAIEELPVDAVILTMDSLEPPLNLQHLMDVGAIRCMFNKYLLVHLPQPVGPGELRGLRDIGVDGVIIDVASASAEGLREMKKHLLNLPKPRKPRLSKTDAVLPHTAYQAPSSPQEEEDDDYDDDE